MISIQSSGQVGNDLAAGTGTKAMLNRKGFVLIEVLVVAIIVGILAAVAIPIYSGYVRNQKQEAVRSLAQTAAVAASAFVRRNKGDAPPDSASLGLFLPQAGAYLVKIQDPNVVVKDASDPDNIQASARFRNP